MPNTLAPDSVADSTILGVCISVNPSAPSASRNPATLAAEISNGARSSGCRSVVGAPSSTAGSDAVTVGRYRSNGGGAAGPDSGVITGEMISAPPGACGLAVTVPSTRMTVSSGSAAAASIAAGSVSTAWARPERSRTIRKVIDLSWRLRCSQPAIITCWPTLAGRSAARIREIITLLRELRDPLGVRARRELAVPPHFRRRRPLRPAAASFGPGDEGRPAGHGVTAPGGRRSSPHSGGSSPRAREAAFSAGGGSLRLARSRATRLRLRVAVQDTGCRADRVICRGDDRRADLPQLPELLGREHVDQRSPDLGDVPGCGLRECGKPLVGELRHLTTAVGRAVRPLDPAAFLQPRDGVRQPALARGRCLGELAH